MSIIPLSMDQQAQISSLCNGLQIPLSEYNFANLYLFRDIHQYRLLSLPTSQTAAPLGDLAVVGVSYDHRTFLMPLFHPQDWNFCINEARKLKVDTLYPIPEIWFDEVRLQGGSLSCRDMDSDYLYLTSSIQEYRGRHFDGHRNAIRQLRDDHDITVARLSVETQSAALRVIDEWAEDHKTKAQQYEAGVCREAVLMAEVLQLEGWFFEVDGYPRGLLIGSPLTHNTYCFHFEKSHRSFRGLPAFMFQTVAKRLDPKYLYLNWEQDLGDTGLRQAKESYRPARKEIKGRVTCR
jgi:hypothetical protein